MKTRSIFGIMHPLTMWWKIKVKMQREPLYCAAMYKVPNASAQKKAHFVFRIQVVDEELNAEDIGHLFRENECLAEVANWVNTRWSSRWGNINKRPEPQR
eukprot:UN23619